MDDQESPPSRKAEACRANGLRRAAPAVVRGVFGLPVLCGVAAVAPYLVLLVPDGRVFPPGVYCDYVSFQLPIQEFARGEWLSGRAPLWIPYLGCGMPLHAGQQSALMYPLLSPLVVLCGANYGIRLSLFLHLALAYVGQYRLARTLQVSRAGSALAGLMVTQSGFAAAHLMVGHVPMLLGWSWFPWLLLSLRLLARAPGASTAAFTAMTAGLMLLTHPQMYYYAGITSAAWSVGSLIAGEASRRRRAVMIWSGVAALWAVLLGSVQLLPALELFLDGRAYSPRGGGEFAGSYALTPPDLIRFVIPNLLGNPFRGVPEPPGGGLFHEEAGYLGLALLALVPWALTRRSAARWEFGAAALALLMLIIALGPSTPVFAILGGTVPGLMLFRCPGRILSMASILLALLAGRGFDALREGRAPRRGAFRISGIILAWIALNIAVAARLSDAGETGWDEYAGFLAQGAHREIAAAALFALLTGAALVICRRVGRSQPRLAAGGVLSVLLLDLGYGNAANLSLVDTPVVEPFQKLPGGGLPDRFVDLSQPGLPAGMQLTASELAPLAIRHGKTMLGTNEDGILPASIVRLHRAIERRGDAALALAACAYRAEPDGEWRPVPDRLPRIRLLPHTHADVAPIPIAEADVNDWPRANSFAFGSIHEDPQRLVLHIQSPQNGVLTVADTAYPGWTCTIDGRTVALRDVHGVFRGVPVPEGSHRVDFRFAPASFRWGLGGTILGLAGVTGAGAAGFIRSKRCRTKLAKQTG